MQPNQVYSGTEVILTINGTIITGAQTLEDCYEYEPGVDRVTVLNSMDGQGSFNINPNKSGTLTVKLLATHPDNDFFAALVQSLDLGAGALPALVQLKKNGGDFIIMGEFMVVGPSTGSFGTVAGERTWKLISPNVEANLGAFGGANQ